MSTNPQALAAAASSFGRRERGFVFEEPPAARTGLSDDARLFAFTFLGGFLFMTVYLA